MSILSIAYHIAVVSFVMAIVLDLASPYQKWLEPLGSTGEINIVHTLLYGTIAALGTVAGVYEARANGGKPGWTCYFLVGVAALLLAVNLTTIGFVAWRSFGA